MGTITLKPLNITLLTSALGGVVNDRVSLDITRRCLRHIAPGGCRRGYDALILTFRWFYPRLNPVKTSIFTASEGGWGRASGIGCAVEVGDRPELFRVVVRIDRGFETSVALQMVLTLPEQRLHYSPRLLPIPPTYELHGSSFGRPVAGARAAAGMAAGAAAEAAAALGAMVLGGSSGGGRDGGSGSRSGSSAAA
eukprot:scaffold12159_cov58-Phaeocystis_antarctica.AAC.2